MASVESLAVVVLFVSVIVIGLSVLESIDFSFVKSILDDDSGVALNVLGCVDLFVAVVVFVVLVVVLDVLVVVDTVGFLVVVVVT